VKHFLAGIVVGFLIFGCAAATTIPWAYYGLQLAEYKNGELLAVDPKNDKDISFCQPASGQKGKCIVMDGADFYAFKQDDLQCHSDLVTCQKGR
jgi:hypothetical protein